MMYNFIYIIYYITYIYIHFYLISLYYIILYNIMNENIIDLWSNNIFTLKDGLMIIKGPSNKNKERLNINFNYDKENNKLYTLSKTNNYNNITLKFEENIVIIENLSKSDIYRGSEYILLVLQISYKLGYKKIKLKDMSYFACDQNMKFFSNDRKNIDTYTEISNKLIYLFRFGGTLYMPFEIIPVLNDDKLTQINLDSLEKNYVKSINYKDYKNISQLINILLESLFMISWNDINNNIIDIEILLNNNNYKLLNINFNFNNHKSDYNTLKIYWKHICKSWKRFYEKFSSIVPGVFLAFSVYDKNECSLFINWLELYSYSMNQLRIYNSSIFNNKLYEEKIVKGLDNYKKLKSLLEKAEWININIKNQPLISIYKEYI